MDELEVFFEFDFLKIALISLCVLLGTLYMALSHRDVGSVTLWASSREIRFYFKPLFIFIFGIVSITFGTVLFSLGVIFNSPHFFTGLWIAIGGLFVAHWAHDDLRRWTSLELENRWTSLENIMRVIDVSSNNSEESVEHKLNDAYQQAKLKEPSDRTGRPGEMKDWEIILGLLLILGSCSLGIFSIL